MLISHCVCDRAQFYEGLPVKTGIRDWGAMDLLQYETNNVLKLSWLDEYPHSKKFTSNLWSFYMTKISQKPVAWSMFKWKQTTNVTIRVVDVQVKANHQRDDQSSRCSSESKPPAWRSEWSMLKWKQTTSVTIRVVDVQVKANHQRDDQSGRCSSESKPPAWRSE